MDAERDLAQLVLHGREPLGDPRQLAAEPGQVGRHGGLRGAELEPERDEPLLGAVVEVALELPPRLVGSGDDTGARGGEVGGEPRQVVDEDAHGAADDEERDQRHDVDGPVDRQRAERLREDDHARREPDDDRHERRPHAADPGHEHDRDQLAEEHAAEAEVVMDRQQRERDQDRRRDGEDPRGALGAREAQRRREEVDPPARRRALAHRLVGRGLVARGAQLARRGTHVLDGSR